MMFDKKLSPMSSLTDVRIRTHDPFNFMALFIVLLEILIIYFSTFELLSERASGLRR